MLEDQKYDDLDTAVRQTVKGFKENRQIWKELEYYRQHGEILGEHEGFHKMKALRELQKLSGIELTKKYRATQKSIAGFRQKIRDRENPDQLEKQRQQLAYREWEMEQLLKIIKALENAEKAL